jgi:hypothetical protein
MAFLRWSKDCDWYLWSEFAPEIKGSVLVIWNIYDNNDLPQKFHPQQIRKILKQETFNQIRHFDPTIIPHMERWLNNVREEA